MGKGTGYYMADNSELQQHHSIECRWETCSHKIVLNHDQFNGFKPPHPDTIFEPYLKVYVIKSNVLFGKVKWVKKPSYDGLSVIWEDLGGFHDEVEYSDLIAEIRDKKLNALGI